MNRGAARRGGRGGARSARALARALGVVALLGAAACGDAPAEPADDAPAVHRIAILAGDDQVGATRVPLARALTVVVTGEDGAPAAGVEVVWRVLEGGGWAEPERGPTDAQGRATTVWTLGDDFGRHLLFAVPEGGQGVTFRAWADLFFTGVSAGWRHSCGLDPAGTAWCWGNNQWGQLGNRGMPQSPESRRVVGGHRFASVTAGRLHSCALTPEGQAFCWGDNGLGQLADGTNVNRAEPVAAAPGRTFRALALGEVHTCGLDERGTVSCWGASGAGQTGVPGTDTCLLFGAAYPCLKSPAAVPLPRPVGKVTAGRAHTCAVDLDGAAWCWGVNDWGQLGVGRFGGSAPAPEPVMGELRFRDIAAGANHTCGVDLEGSAWCWGMNSEGSLGSDTLDLNQDRPRPAAMPPGVGFQGVVAGDYHACAPGSDGAVWCWGASPGTGQGAASRIPVKLGGDPGLGSLTAGGAHTCGFAEGVWCWGANSHGQLGVRTDSVPAAMTPLQVRPGPPR